MRGIGSKAGNNRWLHREKHYACSVSLSKVCVSALAVDPVGMVWIPAVLIVRQVPCVALDVDHDGIVAFVKDLTHMQVIERSPRGQGHAAGKAVAAVGVVLEGLLDHHGPDDLA